MPREFTEGEQMRVYTEPAPSPGPEYVYVLRIGFALYEVRADCTVYASGNESQVHNWLSRHNYKRTQFVPGTWVLGTFKRPKELAA